MFLRGAMSGFPTVNFGTGENSLFSPAEIARLMESEYRRALRYGYPLALLLADIDRLEALHDLYGVDSEQRIVRAVAALLRSSTRASDVLGVLHEQRLLVLLPHTPRAGAAALAKRLLSGCRALEFHGDGRVLRASLSIGTVLRDDEGDLAALRARGEHALKEAQTQGGDRCVEFERLPRRELPRAPLEPSTVPAAVPARVRAPAALPPALPGVHELAGSTLEEKVRTLLELAGGGAGLGPLENEVLTVLQRALSEFRAPRATRAQVLAEMHTLEERVRQLKRMLDASEEELARMVQEKSVDPGLASLYRSVQGLDPATTNYKQKKELLAVIYRANVELLRQLEREAGASG